jgi:hypothetical protein
MTAIGYIYDRKEIVKASWVLFHHDGAAAFILSERSLLPPGLYATDLTGGQIGIFNVHQIRRFNHHPDDSEEESTPQRILESENWLNWDRDLDNANDSKDDCATDAESAIGREMSIEDPEHPVLRDVCATPNVSALFWPTLKSKIQAEMVLVMFNAIQTRRDMGVKKT